MHAEKEEEQMKLFKLFGLASFAAVLTLACVGGTTAMAESTSLCETDPGTGTEEECSTGSGIITHLHEVSVAKATLATTFLTVECDALFLGDTTSEKANPLAIEGNFTYSNCNNGCVVKEENGPAELKVSKEGHETASVTGKGLVHVACGASLDCSYTGEGLKATAKGPLLASQKNGEVSISEQAATKEAGGFLCPKSSKLTIVTTPLTPTRITGSAESTSLCETDPGTGTEEECSTGSGIITHLHEVSVAKATLATTFLTVECDALFLGDTTSEKANPLAIEGNFTYSNCNNGCVVKEENGPAELKVSKEGHETASVTGKGLVHVACGASLDCSYTGEGLKATAKGPLLASQKNGEVSISEQAATKEAGGFLCPKSSKLTIVTTPLTPTRITG
jgi:hypothetical protein